MNSLSNKKRGITLVEIIMVVAIIGLITSLGLLVSFDSYRGYSFRSEQSTLVSVLSRARSRAMSNLYQLPHGVCVDTVSRNYVIFRGNVYSASSPTNEFLGSNPVVTVTSTPSTLFCSPGSGIVFTQLSGTTSPIDIVITEDNRVSTTSINYEGTINW